jgi:hypothetical protein
MNTTLLWGIAALLVCMPLASANLYITELMHSPTQTVSDSDGEWIEIYNSGEDKVNLTDWTIDGKQIGSYTIESEEYFVIARELLDSEDEDTESFESVWGNNNGIWDEPFQAADVTFSLSSEDTVTLANGEYTEEITYNKSFGGSEGRTIVRVNRSSWEEGELGGSPGEGSFTLEEEITEEEEGFTVYLSVSNSVPEILSINLSTDDSTSEGLQVMPNVNQNKTVEVYLEVNDSNGLEDIENVTVSFENKTYVAKETNGTYVATMNLSSQLLAQDYSVTGEVSDGESSTTSILNFSYLGIISTELNVSSLSFELEPGEEEEREVSLTNTGNTKVVTSIYVQEFTGESSISASYLALYTTDWYNLDTPVLLEEFDPGFTQLLLFKMSLPFSVSSGEYTSQIVFESMEA